MNPTALIEIPEFSFPKIVPRGELWNRRAMVMPDDAVPWHRNGFAPSVPASSYAPLFNDIVRNNVNGLRIATILLSTSVSFQVTSISGWVIKRDGVPYDETWSLFQMQNFQASPVTVPVDLVFEPGTPIEFGIQNSVSLLNACCYAIGWEF